VLETTRAVTQAIEAAVPAAGPRGGDRKSEGYQTRNAHLKSRPADNTRERRIAQLRKHGRDDLAESGNYWLFANSLDISTQGLLRVDGIKAARTLGFPMGRVVWPSRSGIRGRY
jgi:hypothetical protein